MRIDFYSVFFDNAAIQTWASSILLYLVHLFVTVDGIRAFAGLFALIFAALTGLMGSLRMYEMWRYQRALRIREEHENKKL